MIEGDRLPTLTADRLALRWLEAPDVDDLYRIFGDPLVMRYWSSPPLQDRTAARALLAEIHDYFERRELFQWGVALAGDGPVIGTCTLAWLQPESARAELGFALGREHWGRGYMEEALRTLLDYAFGPLGLRRLEADIDPRNEASIRLTERLGFRREGLLRERWVTAGEVQDSLFYGLLRREWRGGRDTGLSRSRSESSSG
jgi:RimJ/RimL family protein N-acetyltransferase